MDATGDAGRSGRGVCDRSTRLPWRRGRSKHSTSRLISPASLGVEARVIWVLGDHRRRKVVIPKGWPDRLSWSTKGRPPRVKLKRGGHPRVKWRASPVGRWISSKGVERMDWSSHTTPPIHSNLLRSRRGTGNRGTGDRGTGHRRITRRWSLSLVWNQDCR